MKLIPAAKTIAPINNNANADKSFIFIWYLIGLIQLQVRGFTPFQIKSEWFGENEYCRKDFSYDAVNGQQNAKNKHKQSDNNVFTRQNQKDYKQKCNKARHSRLYF